jgi:hypothetical protein
VPSHRFSQAVAAQAFRRSLAASLASQNQATNSRPSAGSDLTRLGRKSGDARSVRTYGRRA